MEPAVKFPRRDEESINKSLLTGLYFPRIFMEEARRFIPRVKPNEYCMVAIDILHFRLLNKFHGRTSGDKLLRKVADYLEETRKEHGGVTGYFEGDNFCIVMPWQMELIRGLRNHIEESILSLGGTIGVAPALGISPIDDVMLPPEIFYDRATLALTYTSGRDHIACYDPNMEDLLEEEMRLLMEVIDALDRDEFTFFAQPQCDISTGKVVGAESLVRWQHREMGLISPSRFVPLLERAGMIHLLDQQVWEKVCRWMRSWMDRGNQPVPISINISRIDIISMDVPAFLSSLLEKYNLPAKYLKAEITESACAEEDDINDTIDRLQKAGFLVMMDDFGSGYSSLNMLKSIPVDVLKIDMRFLEIKAASEEQKGIGILESIINMARLMGIPVIVEGVETLRQENILRSMGCHYTQGFYHYKPLPIEQFELLLSDEGRLDFNGLHCKKVEPFHVRELIDETLFTDATVNSILGPAAVYDVYEGNIEVTRVNEQYFHLAGMNVFDNEGLAMKLWENVWDDDRPTLLGLFASAYERRPTGAEGAIHYVKPDGKVLWVQVRIFFLREQEEHRIYFVALSDITPLREKRRTLALRPVADMGTEEMERLEQYFGSLPCGYGLVRIDLDRSGKPTGFDIVYINQEMERMCGSEPQTLRHLAVKAFGDDQEQLLDKAYQSAYVGAVITHYTQSAITGHYLQLTLYQYGHGYAACLLQDMTNMQIYERASAACCWPIGRAAACRSENGSCSIKPMP